MKVLGAITIAVFGNCAVPPEAPRASTRADPGTSTSDVFGPASDARPTDLPTRDAGVAEREHGIPCHRREEAPFNQAGDFLPGPRPERCERGTKPFDRRAAEAALGKIDVRTCRRDGGPLGRGSVTVFFEESGYVELIHITSPFEGTPVGECVADRIYALTRIAPFVGDGEMLVRTFDIPK